MPLAFTQEDCLVNFIVNVISAAAQEWRREINMGIPDLTTVGASLNISDGEAGYV